MPENVFCFIRDVFVGFSFFFYLYNPFQHSFHGKTSYETTFGTQSQTTLKEQIVDYL